MNERQRRAILDFVTGTPHGKDALDAVLGFDVDVDPRAVLGLLEEATRDGDAASIECALAIAPGRTGELDVVPALIALLRSDAHGRHEDVARWLQELRDPRAVDALYAAALTEHVYLAHDGGHALARKCTWALADIGTAEAREKLRLLADSDDPETAGYARERLDRWTEELARKGPRRR